MEASAVRRPRLRGSLAAEAVTGSRIGRGFWSPIDAMLREASEIGSFCGRTLLELRGVWRYAAEVLRQCGILITGSALIVCFMAAMMGVVCGYESNYVLRGYGATVYSGVFTSYCGREMIPYMFGYIFAAKIGTGFAAELGAMRIQDEIDAMETIGLNPLRYVVATRLVACWICFPVFYFLVAGFYYLFAFLVLIFQIQEVSQGGWENVHWAFTTPQDALFGLIKLVVFGTVIAMLGMFYGFRARGGPIGVGTATAKSMILNLILIHMLGAGMTMLFWGLKPNAPVGG